MTSPPSFYFDSSTCSGCKACQVACKDKHNLPVGVNWRRVFEVNGGSWIRDGNAYRSNVFAYYFSISCNHCEHPICVDACPARAITQRADGIVTIDDSRCLGCNYCAWACPFGAPQYHPGRRVMTKCDFCLDELEQGAPPTCVAACPLRSLHFEGVSHSVSGFDGVGFGGVGVVGYDYAKPRLSIRAHRSAITFPNPLPSAARVDKFPISELPLIVFTLASQAAVGLSWTSVLLTLGRQTDFQLLESLVLLLTIVAAIASLFHLGHPVRAWRAMTNIQSSWLSREILATVLFGMAAFASLFLQFPFAVQFAAGLLLLFAMANAYALRAQPNWALRWTLACFVTAAALLGIAMLLLVLPVVFYGAGGLTGPVFVLLSIIVLADQLLHALHGFRFESSFRRMLRLTAVVAVGILALLALNGGAVYSTRPISVLLALLLLAIVLVDRINFYTLRVQFPQQ